MRCSAASLRSVAASSAGIVPHAAEAPATAAAAEAAFSRDATSAAAVAVAAFTAETASAEAWKPPAGEPASREATSCEVGLSAAAVRVWRESSGPPAWPIAVPAELAVSRCARALGSGAALDDAPVAAAAAAVAGAAAGAITREQAEYPDSSASMRSASASSVRSLSGRTMRVSAISNDRRGLVDVFNSADRSPKTPSKRAKRSGPNNGSSPASSRRSDSDTSSATSAPTSDITYKLRTRSAISPTNRARSAPVSTYCAVQRKHAAASRVPTAFMISDISLESSDPSIASAPASVTSPSPNAIICSREVSALRRPPSARCAIKSSASPSNSTPSDTHTAPKRATMASADMRRKSNRWQREWIVSGTFCGSVVARMNTT